MNDNRNDDNRKRESLYFHNVMSYRSYIKFRAQIRKQKLTEFAKYMIDNLANTKINPNSEKTLLNCIMKYHPKSPQDSIKYLLLYNNNSIQSAIDEVCEIICINGHNDCKRCKGEHDYVLNSKKEFVPHWNDDDDMYPIQYAICYYSHDIVKYMIAQGAQLNLIKQNYILQFIQSKYHNNLDDKLYIKKSYDKYQTIKLLLQYINLSHFDRLYDENKNDCGGGDNGQKLLNTQYNCDINEYDDHGVYTSLHYAIKLKNYDLIELLIRHKANVNLNRGPINITDKHDKYTVIDMLLSSFPNYMYTQPTQSYIDTITSFCIPILKLLFDNGLKLEYKDEMFIQDFPTIAKFLKQKHISSLEPLSQFVLPIILNNIIFDYAW